MPLSVVDLYQKILPKTNCRDCGYPTCLAFAGMVVSEKLPLDKCPHIEATVLESAQAELDEQYASGKWLKRDLAADALVWARERAASMDIETLPDRIGGVLQKDRDGVYLVLPYFNGEILIRPDKIHKSDGSDLNRWEQVFVFNHMAQGGSALPTGNWKGLEAIPNTISKMKSMKAHVEMPLLERFTGKPAQLESAAEAIGGEDSSAQFPTADVAMRFSVLPRLPVMLLFWDADPDDGFGAEIKLLFDETITEHLDVESIMFLSERIRQLLRGDEM
ncbi:MAG: Fe-S cluster protein [Deltaproteobacteria bacterium]|nr:MAG: Fe-S cluster protein [Deltaproteobacteria bacterium]